MKKSDVLVLVTPGSGGQESADWAKMLVRMYKLWCKRSKLKVKTSVLGRGTDLTTYAMLVGGKDAASCFRMEHGVHRVVRIAPSDPQKRRHTSFAAVEVLPAPPRYGRPQQFCAIRSYIMHPYSLVQDHRTDVTVNDAKSVLDGILDQFVTV